ncbi:MAG: isopentenyl-diphosphate Delta-isomerase [Gammaproteobacteria bacterium]|nr:isopentenyl-diphosphate Delta-isomerase [Gammaproteobacteria bacterium]MDH3767968.1 isopentenyl-diphosphate Delta-isomerase [Gammaproteobacteria bacterium]
MADHGGLRSAVVSSESERLVLVDGQDQEIGFESKGTVHDGTGLLHRAFSLFIFNKQGELLMQQRSAAKRLWPMFWSNSCCSHPREGEDIDDATHRRLREELGMRSDLQFLYRFRYHAQFGELGAEHEFCWVYIGRSDDMIRVNRNEIAAWRWIAIEDLEREMGEQPHGFTPWFRMEWERIRGEFAAELATLAGNI